jgi:hypothetical protein
MAVDKNVQSVHKEYLNSSLLLKPICKMKMLLIMTK